MKFVDDFESFLRTEVNLNTTRLDTLQNRVETIASFIENDDTFEPLFRDVIPAGSWAHQTIIKPVSANDGFDADVLVFLNEQPEWQPKDYIESLYASFRRSATYRGMVHRKTRCVRVDYAGEFHIDLVPYIQIGGLNYIANRHEPENVGAFEASNPEGFTAWIDERQRITNGSFIKVIRLLKYLRDYKSTFSCKSIILTTLLGKQVNEIEAQLAPERYGDVPSTLNTLLSKLAAALPETMPPIVDPAGTGGNFSDRYRSGWDYANFRSQVQRYAEKVDEAYVETDRESSIAVWQEIFGHEFKPGALVKVATLSPRSAGVPWHGEQFIDQPPFGFIRDDTRYRLKIIGRCLGRSSAGAARRRGFRQYNLSTQGNRADKHRSLEFTIASINVPTPYQVFWKVRNGGDEAYATNQLRGEITRDDGTHRRTETTSYKGTHYVECYVVKDGVVVARDRQTVIVT